MKSSRVLRRKRLVTSYFLFLAIPPVGLSVMISWTRAKRKRVIDVYLGMKL